MTLESGASRVMTTEAVTALASAAVNNYARRWNTIGCELTNSDVNLSVKRVN